MLQSFLFNLADHRRKQGQRYQLGHILLFTVLAMLSQADSYRKIAAFMAFHYPTLDDYFKLGWKQPPAYSTIRNIINGISSQEFEQGFRQYSQKLATSEAEVRLIHCDGKALRGSFDHFQDQPAVHLLSALLGDSQIILAHEELTGKGQEISAVQTLLQQLGLTGHIFTLDALHCQKKP